VQVTICIFQEATAFS